MPHGPRQLQQTLALAIVEFLEIGAGAGVQGGGLLFDRFLEPLDRALDQAQHHGSFFVMRPCAGAHCAGAAPGGGSVWTQHLD